MCMKAHRVENKSKMPAGVERRCASVVDSFWSHMDTDTPGVEGNVQTAITPDVEQPKHADRWRRVSAVGIDVYVPLNMVSEVLGTTCQKIAFGQVENAGM